MTPQQTPFDRPQPSNPSVEQLKKLRTKVALKSLKEKNKMGQKVKEKIQTQSVAKLQRNILQHNILAKKKITESQKPTSGK